jgi:hypothetical protein
MSVIAWRFAITSPKQPKHLSTRRLALDPIDGLSGQASFIRDVSDAHRLLPQHGAHSIEMIARVAWLAAEVSALVIPLRVLDTGPLRRLGGLSLGLRGRRHEGDQRVTNCLLHRVLRGTVEREVVNHSADHNATA